MDRLVGVRPGRRTDDAVLSREPGGARGPRVQGIYHHYSVTGEADNAQAFAEHKDELRKAELEGLRRDISTQKYKEAGYNFAITIRSGRNPKNVYFHTVFTPEELK